MKSVPKSSSSYEKNSISFLMQYLADIFFLYLKTHNYHINVTGMHFYSLHKFFEDQYKEWFENIDATAERIRTQGATVSYNYSTLKKLTQLNEVSEILTEKEMLKDLLKDNQTMIQQIKKMLPLVNEIDPVSADFLIEKQEHHEKTVWMLQSHLES